MKYYNLESLENLIQRYADKGGEVVQFEEGCLGLGTVILRNNGLPLKEYVIKERYYSAYSSVHTCTTYTRRRPLPKKYADFEPLEVVQ